MPKQARIPEPLLARLNARLTNVPMAMERRALSSLRHALSESRAGLFDDFLADREQRRPVAPPGVALIPITGPLMHQSIGDDDEFLASIFGFHFYSGLQRSFDEALDDPAVRRIVFDIDSPGGEVSGLLDFVESIAAARGRKPITALVDETAASAAYAIASAADRIVIPRTGTAGSIGVIAVHVDESGLNERIGLHFTYMTSGARKADGNPDEPLSEDARTLMQSEVDRVARLLFDVVARNRGLSVDAVAAQQAGVFHGAQAVEAGLADAVGPVRGELFALAERGDLPLSVNRRHKHNHAQTTGPRKRRSRKEGRKMGQRLASTLETAIEAQVTEDRTRADVIEDMAQAAGIDSGTVNSILNADIDCPPLERLDGFAEVLDVSADSLRRAAGEDGCEYDTGNSASSRQGVVDPHSKRAGRRDGLAYATEINELCMIAGHPEMAAAFMRDELPVAQVRNKLLEARANDGPGEIDSNNNGGASPAASGDMWRGVLAKRGVLKQEGGDRR